ncbi:MAG TPA: DNA-processing protein DprA [Solirubrobacteraceae bacterium]|nr:DNA-processing protein DprA [Solirubrobacteraceae bacterium]
MSVDVRVCGECARRAWLLERLSGHLDPVRERVAELLELDDRALIQAVGGARHSIIAGEFEARDPEEALEELRARLLRAELEAVCRCEARYPAALRDLPAPPAVLHVLGGLDRLGALLEEPPVALVGARRPSGYGLEATRMLAAGLARAGLPVVSGMALGIDAAAHRAALDAAGATIAVLPGGADVVYPGRHRRLHTRIRESGVAVSELGPGVAPRRWMFTARNRIIAALADLTVLVQGRERSGALVTAGCAARLGRRLGAVPGPATAPLSAAPHRLLRDGASLIATVQDALDALYGIGVVAAPRRRAARLEPPLAALLEAIAEGETEGSACARAGLGLEAGLAALARLELDGLVRRGPGGRYVMVAS